MPLFRITVLLACAFSARALAADGPCVATVGGHPISAAEVLLFVAHDRAAIARECFAGRPAVTEADWNEPAPGGSALQRLGERALSDAIEAKRLQIVASAAGLLPDTDFSAFEASLESENAHRRLALQAGEPVYGPQQWPQAMLYWQRQALLRSRLASSLGDAQAAERLAKARQLPATTDLAPLLRLLAAGTPPDQIPTTRSP